MFRRPLLRAAVRSSLYFNPEASFLVRTEFSELCHGRHRGIDRFFAGSIPFLPVQFVSMLILRRKTRFRGVGHATLTPIRGAAAAKPVHQPRGRLRKMPSWRLFVALFANSACRSGIDPRPDRTSAGALSPDDVMCWCSRRRLDPVSRPSRAENDGAGPDVRQIYFSKEQLWLRTDKTASKHWRNAWHSP